MPVQDSNAERRNLTVTSLAFVAYYYCGGAVANDQFTIQVVSLKFLHPELLALLAWISLLWFLLRYWQTNKGKFKNVFFTELRQYVRRPYLVRLVEESTGLKPNQDGGFNLDSIWYYDKGTGAHYGKIGKGTYGADGWVQSYESTGDGIVYFKGIKGRVALLRVLFTCSFENPSFAEYVAPYILFFLALCGPLYRGAL